MQLPNYHLPNNKHQT